MLIIGLTGGIGSGKSTVAELFRQLGIPVIDTDLISRQLVEPGMPALEEIKSSFVNVTTSAGELDRLKLRQVIFDNADKRQQLENILHPRILDEVKRQLSELHSPYVIVVIPLLAEKGKWGFIDRVLVIDCDEQLQFQRTMKRDNQDKEQIQKIIKSQASRQQRLALASDIISNESDLDYLEQQVMQLDNEYRKMASN
ncbi:MAG: dephospho-CoA kinase [Gammaproteobacteria bacterium]